MSSNIPGIDISTAIVGSMYKMDFAQFVNVDPGSNEPSHIRVYNDSGCLLNASFIASGRQEFIPAGGWIVFSLKFQDTQIEFTVLSIIPNALVSIISAVYYEPYEDVPMIQVGNAPVAISGTVKTSAIQTLSNEGGASTGLIIDIGDVTISQLFTIYAGGQCVWDVDQSGVSHRVITINASGTPLKLGQSGDTTEVMGNMLFDAGPILPNAVALTAQDTLGTARNLIYVDAANKSVIQMGSGNILSVRDSGNNELVYIDSNGSVVIGNNVAYSTKDAAGTVRPIIKENISNDVLILAAGSGTTRFTDGGASNWSQVDSAG